MNKMINKTGQLLAFGVVSSFGASALASTPPSTAITPGPEKAEVEVQVLYQSKDSVRPNRYMGPTSDGEELSISGEVVQKNSKKDNRFSHLLIEGAGTHHPYYRARMGEQGNFSIAIEYRERPKYQYLDLQAPFSGSSLYLPQLQTGQTLGSSMQSFDISHKRAITRISGQKVFDPQWRLNLVVNREDKTGNDLQGFGYWMDRSGFQMPSPINQRTDQVGLTLEYFTPKMQGRVGYNLSQFRQLEDNFFSAQQPMAFTTAGATSNLGDTRIFSLAPENTFHQVNGQFAYSFSSNTKVSTELDVARAEQDDDYVRDYTSINFEDTLNLLTGNGLNAKIDTTRFAVRATHRLSQGIMLRANYRFDDRNNKTDVVSVKSELGTVRDIRAHDMRRNTADFDMNMRLFGHSNWLIGAKFENTDRTTADRGTTDEATIHTRLRSRWTPKVSTGLNASYAMRTGSTYDDTITSNHEAMRKYFLASVDRINAAANANWSVLPQLALGLEVTWKEDDYKKSELGLQKDNRLATTLTADYFPSARFSGTAYATYEGGKRDQNGVAEHLKHDTITTTFGLSGKGKVTADGKWNLGGDVLVMRSDIDIKASSGNDYPTLKSNLSELRLYGDWKAKDNLTLKLSYILQDYEESDWALGYGQIPNGSGTAEYWLMGAPVYDDTIHIIVGSLAYKF